jgi:hypothetical protein
VRNIKKENMAHVIFQKYSLMEDNINKDENKYCYTIQKNESLDKLKSELKEINYNPKVQFEDDNFITYYLPYYL